MKAKNAPITATHPALCTQWDYQLNGPEDPKLYTAGSRKVVWWTDELGHQWEASIQNRSKLKATGCPYCSGNKVLAGFNDLTTANPEIASQWSDSKNPLRPSAVLPGSNKKVWWEDRLGHQWEATPNDRTNSNHSCPYCSGNKVLAGFNDLASANTALSKEWHPTKNGMLTPEMVTVGSSKLVVWRCAQNHEWTISVAARKKTGCPACATAKLGHKKRGPVAGVTDFATVYPSFAAEWHPTKNGMLLPEHVNSGTSLRVWFQCSKQHEWDVKISDRVYYNTSCPACASTRQVSAPEKELYEFLTALGLPVIQSDRTILKGKELDLYIPSKSFAIEYNGLYWHSEEAGKDRHYHYDKWLESKKAGVQLIQIWEDDWNSIKPLILRSLANKLGVTAQLDKVFPELTDDFKKIGANKTSVVTLDKVAGQTFLSQNHLQGFASGSHYLGLQDRDGRVRAVMVLRREADNILNIVRYATHSSVMGGFTKLVKHAEKAYKPNSFVTFADHTISNGGLYENNGFVADKELRPDYMYIVGGIRKHKFGFRLKRFRNDADLQWEDNLTERELATLNGIPRIWDAGKTRYIKEV